MIAAKPQVLVAHSGGMDSTTLLHKAVATYGKDRVLAVSVWYGSKHNPHELAAAALTCQKLGVERTMIDLGKVFVNFKSDLLTNGGKVPEGHYTDASMSRTVVPGRNLIFASTMIGLADSLGAHTVWLGVHAGDHAIYPDCRPEFITALDRTAYLATEGRVRVAAPYLNVDKVGILNDGRTLGVDYAVTRTCYTNQATACGKCGSCCERLTAFDLLGVPDPLEYADRTSWKAFTPA